MTRDDILRLADKHATLTAGWMFSVPDMEDFYIHAYEAGVAAEREACARFLESGVDLKGLAGDPQMQAFCGALLMGCAKAIRARGET